VKPVRLGPFEIVEPLAEGGMSQVWRAQHAGTRIPVAIKVMTEDISRNAKYQTMFASEVRATAQLRHPSVALVLDHGLVPENVAARIAGLAPGCPYMVTEYASGGSLARCSPQPWQALREILLQLLEALSHAHARGVIHRDVKPGNVLLCTDGDVRPGWKLADFGIAVFADDLREETSLTGTLRYMAPEQVLGQVNRMGPWTDLYAVGVLTWRLALGAAPFKGTTGLQAARKKLYEIAPPLPQVKGMPTGLKRWVGRLLERDPTRRYRCAADAHWALTSVDGDEFEAPPPVPKSWRRGTPRPLPVKLVGAGLGVYGLRSLPVVGRLASRDRLWEAVRSVHENQRPKVILIRGTEGVGKSCLANWLAERAEEVGAAQSWTAGPDGPEQMLRGALRIRDEGSEDLRQRVEQEVSRWGGNEVDVGIAMQLVDPSSGSAKLTSATQRHGALVRLLQLAAQRRPVVIRIHDAHDALDSIRFCEAVLDTPGQLPVLMVITARDEALLGTPLAKALVENLAEDDDAETLLLRPLGGRERQTLVRELLGLAPALAGRVEERTAGNPLFAIQLVGEWIQRDLLVLEPDGFALRPGAEDTLPTDVMEVWAQRIDHLLDNRGSAAGTALESAAVLGVSVDANEWWACTGELSDAARERLLGAMFEQRLAITEERGWAFAHGMLREVLLARSRAGDRLAAQHLAVAAHLQDRPQNATILNRIGRHLLAGGEPAAALKPLRESWLEEYSVLTTEELSGRLETLVAAVEAAHLPKDHVMHVELERGEARRLQRMGQMDASGRVIERALAMAKEHHHDDILDELLSDQVVGERMKPRGGVGRDLARKMIDTGNGGKREAFGWHQLSWLSLFDGDSAAAAEQGRRALVIAHKIGALTLLRDSQEVCGMAALNAGRLPDAQRAFTAGLKVAQDMRDPNQLGRILVNLGEVARMRGDLDEAERCYRLAVKNWTALGVADVATAWLNIGLVGIGRRDFTAARRGSEAFKLIAKPLHRSWYASVWHALESAIHAGTGDGAGSQHHAHEATRLVEEHGRLTVDEAWAMGIAGDVWAERDEQTLADEVYGRARALWKSMDRQDEVDRIDACLTSMGAVNPASTPRPQ